jgi:hypothetical protein
MSRSLSLDGKFAVLLRECSLMSLEVFVSHVRCTTDDAQSRYLIRLECHHHGTLAGPALVMGNTNDQVMGKAQQPYHQRTAQMAMRGWALFKSQDTQRREPGVQLGALRVVCQGLAACRKLCTTPCRRQSSTGIGRTSWRVLTRGRGSPYSNGQCGYGLAPVYTVFDSKVGTQ